MTRGKPWLRGVFLLTIGMLAAATLSIAPATAGKFLTKKRALRLFYPRAEADARFIEVGEKATSAGTADNADTLDNIDSTGFLTPAQGDSSYLPATGELRINASPMTWQVISAAPGVPPSTPSIGSTTFGGSSGMVSDVPIAISPTLPTELNGRSLELVGVNACYATDAVTTLDVARIQVTTNAAGAGSTSTLLTDTEDRTDINCRNYTLSTPEPIAPEDDIAMLFTVDYSTNAGFFSAGRATFILAIV